MHKLRHAISTPSLSLAAGVVDAQTTATRRLALVLATALAVLAPDASAQTRVWNFGDQTAPGACTRVATGGTNGIGNVYGCSEQPGGTTNTLFVAAYNAGTTASSAITAAAVTPQGTASGFGVGSAAEGGVGASSSNGNHALDNNNGGGADMLLLQFLAPQVLQSVTIGWFSNDADLQVLRWGGTGLPPAVATVGGLLTSGWQLAATLRGYVSGGNADTDRLITGVNPGTLASSYWAISAYNPAFGTSAGFTADANADRFKVLAVSAIAPPPPPVVQLVPEPSTVLLLGAGIVGLAAARRRRVAA